MTDLTSTIARLRELEAKATPGPWRTGFLADDSGDFYLITDAPGYQPPKNSNLVLLGEREDQQHFEFFAALRNAAPALLDAAERAEQAEAERDRLRAMIDQDTAELTGPVYEQIKVLTVERDRLAAERAEAKALIVRRHGNKGSASLLRLALADLHKERDRLAARVAELEAGLAPFAKMADVVDVWRRGTQRDHDAQFDANDLYRARALLEPKS